MNREGQVVGMAGAVAAVQQALEIARQGRADPAISQVVIDGTLRIDAEDAPAVYGGVPAMQPVLRALREFMQSKERDPIVVRTLITLMQLERTFSARPDVAVQVSEGVKGAAAHVARPEGSHRDAVPRLGELYAGTVSQLMPRVMIPGDPSLLARAEVVTAVRAHLLAALRGTVLWRQCGGNRINVWFSWKALLADCDRMLAEP